MARGPADLYRLPKRLVKSFYSFAVRSIFPPSRPSRSDFGVERSILVIRTDGLGDLMLATPTLKFLRQSYPEHRIILLTRQEWVDVVRNCSYIDEVIPWNIEKYSRNLFYRLRFVRELRSRNFSLALHPVYSREPKIDEVLCCCRAVEKIGFNGGLNNISLEEKTRNDSHYTILIQNGSNETLEIDRNRNFTAKVTGTSIEPADFQPEFWLAESDRATARKLLSDAGLNSTRDLVVAMVPGAAWKGREWPARSYAEIADRLAVQYGAKIVILGSRTDEPVASSLASGMRTSFSNLAGKTRLGELAAILQSCSLYIGNETGPLHLAVAAGIPTLGIVGGGHFGRFYPYGDLNRHRMVYKKMDCFNCDWNCIHESVRCIQEIAVDDVWRATQRILTEVVLPERERVLRIQDGATFPG